VKVEARLWFWVESGLALLSSSLLLLTLVWPDWIEAIFGIDPDNHNGAAEWLITAALVAVTLTSILLARMEWRRAARQ